MVASVIKVIDIVGGPLCMTPNQGEQVYQVLKGYLVEGLKVELDFEGINVCIPPFIGSAIGALCEQLSDEEIWGSITITNLSSQSMELLKDTFEHCRRLVSDPEYARAVNKSIRDLQEDMGSEEPLQPESIDLLAPPPDVQTLKKELSACQEQLRVLDNTPERHVLNDQVRKLRHSLNSIRDEEKVRRISLLLCAVYPGGVDIYPHYDLGYQVYPSGANPHTADALGFGSTKLEALWKVLNKYIDDYPGWWIT